MGNTESGKIASSRLRLSVNIIYIHASCPLFPGRIPVRPTRFAQTRHGRRDIIKLATFGRVQSPIAVEADMIHRFRVQNFKSIVDVTVDFSDVTVLVGRSGTGKSNFLEAIRALRDFLSFDGQQGSLIQEWAQTRPAMDPKAVTQFEIEFSIAGIDEPFFYKLSIGNQHPQQFPKEEYLRLGDKMLLHQEFTPEQAVKWIVRPDLLEVPNSGPLALGRIPSISEAVVAYTALTSGIGCYVFSDQVLTVRNQHQMEGVIGFGGGHPIQSSTGLDDKATNYLSTLRDITSNLQDLNVKKGMVAALQRLNPSVSSAELNDIQNPSHVIVGHKFNGKTLALQLAQESDGFRRFYAHLLALYQRPPKQTLLFEHPEDGIHPGALSLLADEFNTAPADGRGQIVLTTHSPELLDHFQADQIRVVELEGSQTRIGPVSEEQKEAIQEKLLDPGELLTVDPARIKSHVTETGPA